MEENHTAHIKKDEDGNILVDKNGNITCVSKEGVIFQLRYQDIDFTCDTVQCTVDDKIMFIRLHVEQSEQTNNPSNEIHNIDYKYGHDDNYSQNENDANYYNTNRTEQDKRETMLWDDAKTKLFLQLYKENNDLLANRKIKTKKVLWQKIRGSLQKHGYNVTLVQVENKYKSLERSYKNMVTNNKKTGRARMSCPYEVQLTELLGHKHNIRPLALSGRQGLLLRDDVRMKTSLPTCDENNQSTINSQTEINIEPMTSKLSTIAICDTITDSEIVDDPGLSQPSTHNKQKKQMSRMARISETWQKTIENLLQEIQRDKEAKNEIQRQLLEEYKAIRNNQEEFMKSIQEQLIQANKLREERNKLLKEMYLRNQEGERN